MFLFPKMGEFFIILLQVGGSGPGTGQGDGRMAVLPQCPKYSLLFCLDLCFLGSSVPSLYSPCSPSLFLSDLTVLSPPLRNKEQKSEVEEKENTR